MTDAELEVLEALSETDESFRALGRTPGIREALTNLVEADYIAVYETEDSWPLGKLLSRAGSLVAIADDSNWTDPRDPPVPIVRYHIVRSSPAGDRAFAESTKQRLPD
jgi:hypothetical protein